MLVSYLKYSSRNHLYSRQDAYFSSAKQLQPGRVESLREKTNRNAQGSIPLFLRCDGTHAQKLLIRFLLLYEPTRTAGGALIRDPGSLNRISVIG